MKFPSHQPLAGWRLLLISVADLIIAAAIFGGLENAAPSHPQSPEMEPLNVTNDV